MKKLIFVFFLSLLATLPAVCQATRTFYIACHVADPEKNAYEPFRQNQLQVRNLSDDSITFESTEAGAGHIFTAKKVAGNTFMESDYGGNEHFYAYKIDDNSFYLASYFSIVEGYGAWTYYKSNGPTDPNAKADFNQYCQIDTLRQFLVAVKPYEEGADARRKATAEKAEADRRVRYQQSLDSFLKNLRNRRTDPALEKGITAWWKEATNSTADPKLRFYMLTPNYDIVRNAFGEVLRKEIDVLMVNKGNDGKCEMSWRTFGYESLGGGTFDTALKNWVKRVPNSGELQGIALPGDAGFLDTGTYYPVACPTP